MDLLSKKELLRLTGISYGQLYRWKRQGLIPENWFQKQASSTGQETFFPREQMLVRVQTILELKATHSLEEMRAMLSPDITGTRISAAQLKKLGIADWLTPPGEDTYSFAQTTFLHILMMAAGKGLLPRHTLAELAQSGIASAEHHATAEKQLTLFRAGNSCHTVFSPEGALAFDDSIHVIAQYRIAEEAEQLKPTFHQILAHAKEE